MTRPEDFAALGARALDELKPVLAGISSAESHALVEALAGAKRIAVHGLGREGLMMRALAMRLFHMGLDVHVTGDMTVPPLGPGDLFVVSAGPGELETVAAYVSVAKKAGARTACITAQPQGSLPRACDMVLTIPAQTMANDTGGAAVSVLPRGSMFEGAQYMAFELLVLALRDRIGETPDTMRARHTNLE